MSTLDELYEKYDSLTPKQRVMFDYVTRNPERICFITLKQMSAAVGAAEISVLRFCRALGFDGFLDMKTAFRQNAQSIAALPGHRSYHLEKHEPFDPDGWSGVIGQIVTQELSNVQAFRDSYDAPSIRDAAQRILQAEEVLIFWHEGCRLLADYLTHRLSYLHIKASTIALDADRNVRACLARMQKEHCCIFFSFPCYFPPTRNIVRIAESRDASVIVITDQRGAPAVTVTGVNFYLRTTTKTFSNSFTAPTALISVLTSYLSALMGSRIDAILQEELQLQKLIESDSDSLSYTPG